MSEVFDGFRREVDFMWRLMNHNWIHLMLSQGKVDREALAMLTLQMYHYVKNTVPVFQLALTLLPEEEEHVPMRRMLEYFAHDEAGHDRVALRDLARMGYDPEACAQTLPLPTTLNLHGTNKLAVEEYGPYYLLGETYATETLGASISMSIYDAYRHDPELSECLAFYDVHGEADVEHAARSEEVLRHYLPMPGRRRPLLLGCLSAWKNLTQLGLELQTYKLYPAEFQLPPRRSA